MLSIADDLIILAVGLNTRLGPNTGQLSARFPTAMRGAELVALASAGRVVVEGDAIRVRDTTPLGDPGLDAALAAAPAPVRAWMDASPGGFVTARFERLAAAGLLRGERYMLLLIAPRTAYRLANDEARQRFEQLRNRLYATLNSTGPLDADELALVALVHAGDLSRFAYPGKAGEPARARIAELAASAGLVTGGRPGSTAPDQGIDPNLLFPHTPGPEGHHQQESIFSAVNAAVAASVNAAVSITVDSATHHHHSSSSSDSSPSHHHH